jgi:lipooligosaccharide transport system permease protein
MPVPFSALPKLSHRVWLVWRRNADVFMKTYKVNFFPPLVEPLIYLVGLGMGLGNFVQPQEGLRYLAFIGPALVAVSMMYSSFFECTYGSFVRMYYQRTFDAIIATPVNLDEVIAGEILWGATKSLINASIVLAVVMAFGLVSSPLALLIPPFALVVGALFASIAMCFTAVTPNIDSFNYPSFLYITPMFILSGTFFTMTSMPQALQLAARLVFPLTHAVALSRSLALGRTHQGLLFSLGWILVVTPAAFCAAIKLMKKRLVK